jgi:hypothetical protein
MTMSTFGCQVAVGANACTAPGTLTIPPNTFVDFAIGSSAVDADVWTVLICN